MKRLITVLVLLAACALTMAAKDDMEPSSPDAVTADSARLEIVQLTQQLNQAAVKDDAGVFQRLLAENYTAFNNNGELQTKPMIVDATRRHAVHYTTINTRIIDVQVSGDRIVATDISNVAGTVRHRPFYGTYGSKRVWERRDGQWQVVSLRVFPAKEE